MYVIQKDKDYYLSEYGAFNYKINGAKLFESKEEAKKVASRLDGVELKELVLRDASDVLKVKKLSPTAKVPTKAHAEDAGWDIYADEDVIISNLSPHAIRTGIALELPKGTYGRLVGRSGLTLKTSLKINEGTIDEPYRGELVINAEYRGDLVGKITKGNSYISIEPKEPYVIHKGDKIAQLVIQEHLMDCKLKSVEDLSETKRGKNGFGSTGK